MIPLSACLCSSLPGGNKTRSERMGAPPFTMLIEFLSPRWVRLVWLHLASSWSCNNLRLYSVCADHAMYRSWRLHRNLAESVDLLLTNRPTNSEIRWFDKDGQMQVCHLF
jgi:hypothetical protein